MTIVCSATLDSMLSALMLYVEHAKAGEVGGYDAHRARQIADSLGILANSHWDGQHCGHCSQPTQGDPRG